MSSKNVITRLFVWDLSSTSCKYCVILTLSDETHDHRVSSTKLTLARAILKKINKTRPLANLNFEPQKLATQSAHHFPFQICRPRNSV